MKTDMTAASYHSRILSPKYGQTGNVKPLTTNRSLMFAVKFPNLDLKVSNTNNLSVERSRNHFNTELELFKYV